MKEVKSMIFMASAVAVGLVVADQITKKIGFFNVGGCPDDLIWCARLGRCLTPSADCSPTGRAREISRNERA